MLDLVYKMADDDSDELELNDYDDDNLIDIRVKHPKHMKKTSSKMADTTHTVAATDGTTGTVLNSTFSSVVSMEDIYSKMNGSLYSI